MRLIDADALKRYIPTRMDMQDLYLPVHFKTLIDEQPTVDAVPVRCRDCKWWDNVDNIDGVNYGTCERKCTAIRKDAFLNENWFCADGERR